MATIPGGTVARSSAANETSVAIASSATSSAPPMSWSYSCNARPSTMKRPSAPPATRAPRVAVATTFTAAVRMPERMTGRPRGTSIRRRIWPSLSAIPRDRRAPSSRLSPGRERALDEHERSVREHRQHDRAERADDQRRAEEELDTEKDEVAHTALADERRDGDEA